MEKWQKQYEIIREFIERLLIKRTIHAIAENGVKWYALRGNVFCE